MEPFCDFCIFVITVKKLPIVFTKEFKESLNHIQRYQFTQLRLSNLSRVRVLRNYHKTVVKTVFLCYSINVRAYGIYNIYCKSFPLFLQRYFIPLRWEKINIVILHKLFS